MVPEIFPEQLSVVFGVIKVRLHCALMSGKTGVIGAVVSFIITFCFVVAIFPFPSSKIQFIV